MEQVVESEVLTRPSLRARDVQAYAVCELVSGILLCSMIVFTPWAFGTTEPWSIWTVNAAGYALGACLLIKSLIRRATGYRPAQWRESIRQKCVTRALKPRSQKSASAKTPDLSPTPALLTRALVTLTFLLLAYSFVGAINARATFDPVLLAFQYHDYLRWLPHSLDSRSTWEISWRYLALACTFWAAQDWLIGKPTGEQGLGLRVSQTAFALVPHRVRLVLWIALLSGGILAFEGIAQRLVNSSKLLFLVQPQIHQAAETQFATYAYRANAGQYFNLLWPVSLGFWWEIRHAQSWNPWRKIILLVCTGTMVACPVISGARGAAVIDVAMLLAAGLGLSVFRCVHNPEHRPEPARSAAWVILFLVGALALGAGLGWKQFRPRLEHLKSDLLEREELYDSARFIARDYPVFGAGPGAFEQVFQLYRASPQAYWPAQLHNDWLETRITFGWIGTALVAAALLVFVLCCFSGEGFSRNTPLAFCLWLSLAGCLVQARWDFPLQIYSIQMLFVVWCALLLTVSGASSRRRKDSERHCAAPFL